ncbi:MULTISPECIES: bifunctional diguanylate cyclase/phosphodiesterase [unclassified Rhizobacter]|uniref:putative bifunctional diguanylate cyclase/phosphodiesterase n=1 Tax=unclassified Rhizobacter TaxID=2640088 RepID=UPI0009E806CD|nr:MULTISPECIES: EAL domain-containing protein [unclassified Rhizobacter]
MTPTPLRELLRPTRWPHWIGSSLGTRIVVLFLGLLLIVQAASFFAIRASIDRNARASITEELQVGERVLTRVLDQNAQKLAEGASLLAADYGFRAAVSSNDADTTASVLANHGERIGATVTALLDTEFQLRAAAQPGLQELLPVTQRLAARALASKRASEIVVLGQRPFQLVMVPMRAPVVVGWVLMGFPIDQRLVDDMHALSSLQVSLQVRTNAASKWSTAVSTLPPATRDALEKQAALSLDRVSGDALPASSAALTLSLLDNEYSGRTVMLAEHDGAAVSALLLRSVDDAVAPYRQLQLGLAALTLVGVLVFGIGSVLTARHVTTPLRRLATAAERLGAGDYSTPLRGLTRSDELGDVARAFERMRENIGEQQDEILKLAYWDPLTALPNRVQFRNAVRDAIVAAGKNGRSVSVIMLDLDRFKHVNDVLGYRFGDLLLRGVAERLTQQAVRGGDLVARLGGDEFAVLLAGLDPATDLALTGTVARRIQQAFDAALTLEDQTVDISASLGLANWPLHAGDADVLLSRAEVAMYTAKRRHDGPMVYDPALDAASSQTLSLLSELRHAVDHDELRLYLQPKLALGNARVVGAEALVRWQHPRRGLVPPVEFIPFAEQTGFIRVLTLWIFEQTAQMWKRLHDGGQTLTISVNLSTRDLLDPELPQKFDALLVRHSVPAEAFCLEITESAIMDDPQRAQATLDKLSALGFRLSIDDFGTGYSSLAYLKRLPVDELKIDKSFVLNMEKDLDDARIVRSTIDLAHGLGLTVVAEGVENAQVWELLRELACDEAQGFHMGRPMPAAEFARWSTGWSTRQAMTVTLGKGPDVAITLH